MQGHRVDFALLLYDEFDGASLAGAGPLFYCAGELAAPLRKREGYYVFCDLGRAQTELEIICPHYRRLRRLIDRDALDPGLPVVRIRLERDYSETFTDCEWLHGRCPPGSAVMAFAPGERARLQSVEGEARLTLPGFPAGGLLGRRFALDTSGGDSFLLTRMPAPGIYALEGRDAPERGEPVLLHRAYRSRSGEDGVYHIPVEPGQTEKIVGTAYWDGEAGRWVYASAAPRS